MRVLAGLALCVILNGCAATPSSDVSCRPYDPDPDEVAGRVLAAHRFLSPTSVLKCLSVQGQFELEDFPDEEACVVGFDARANEGALTAFYTSRSIGTLPVTVSQLAGNALPLRARGSWSPPSKREPLIYETSDPQTAILYKPHVRCLDLRGLL
jgi:hypothetical protein